MKLKYLIIPLILLSSCSNETSSRQRVVVKFESSSVVEVPQSRGYFNYIVKTKDGCIWYAESLTKTGAETKIFDGGGECTCPKIKVEKE